MGQHIDPLNTYSGCRKDVFLQLLFGLFLLLLEINNLSGQQLLVAFNLQESDVTQMQKRFVYKMHLNSSITHHRCNSSNRNNILHYNFVHFYCFSLLKVQKVEFRTGVFAYFLVENLVLDVIAFTAIIDFIIWDGLFIENCNLRKPSMSQIKLLHGHFHYQCA